MQNKFTTFLMTYLFIMWNLIELLLAPLIFATVGCIYHVSWQYYMLTIGGYFGVMVVWELLARYVCEDSAKKYHCPFVRKLKKIQARLNAAPQENAQ